MRYLGRLLFPSLLLAASVAAHAGGIPVSGRVLGPGGAPVGEADVELIPLSGAIHDRRAMLDPTLAEPVAGGRTNAHGRYRLEAPRAGLWRLRVSADGFVPLVTDLRPLIEETELEDAKLRADSGMNVRVTNASGEPLAGATVLLWPDGRRAFSFLRDRWRVPPRFAIADAEGKVRLPTNDLETVSLSAWAPGHELMERRGVRGTAATLALPSGPAAAIEVFSDSDTAVAGALVALGRGQHPVGFTDEHGQFTVVLEPGSSRKLALGAVDGRYLDTSIDVPPPAEPRPDDGDRSEDGGVEVRRFVLPDQLEVAGKLIDGDTRRPVAGGLVWDIENPDRAAATDEGGGFALACSADTMRGLTAAAAGYLNAAPAAFRPGSGGPGPTLSLLRAAAIEGVVVDADGDPVVDAEVDLRPRSSGGFPVRSMFLFLGNDLARTSSREDGTFRLSRADPEGSWLVRADAEGFAPVETPVSGLEPGHTLTGVEITLTPGLTIAGTFVDAAGVPVSGVTVKLKHAAERGAFRLAALTGDEVVYEASSGTDGRFTARDLPAGKFDLETERAGFAPRRMSAIETDEVAGELELGEIELQPGETLSGYVTDPDGRPIEGVEVRAGGSGAFFPGLFGGSAPEADAVTDASGWFQVADLAAGEQHTLAFQRTGYVRESMRAVEAPREEPLQVELDPASEVRGTILSDGERPVPGALVRVVRMRDFGFGRRGAREFPLGTGRTDDDGRFAVEGVSPGKAAVVCDAPGYRQGRLEDLEIPVGENLEGLELRLDHGAVVRGSVTGPDGRPVIGARVNVVRDDSAPVSMTGMATTDGDGRYVLDGLAPGEVSIEAKHREYPRVVRDVEVRVGANRLDLSFEGGVDVSGYVFDAVGNPVADASVVLAPAGRSWGGPTGRSESDGSFAIAGVQDGDYELSAQAEGYARAPVQSVTVTGRSVGGLEIRLDAGATLEGAILGLDAESFARVTVRANAGSFRDSRSGVADYRGTYRVEHLLPGEYQVVATDAATGRQARGSVTVEPDVPALTLDLEFEEGLVLSGRAVQGDEPIVGASVSARGIDVDLRSSAVTDPDGGFELDGLQAGRYQVSLVNWRTGLSHEETIDVGTSREIVLRVPTAAIDGQVVDASDGEPLAGVAVFAERDTVAGSRPVIVSTTTDSGGRFEIANVADGEWRLTANKKGYAARTETVIVQADDGPDDVEIAMSATEGLTLEVRLPSGAVPDQVYAAVLDGAGSTLVAGSYATGEGGRVRLSSVPPGSWELLVGAAGSATTSFAVSAPGPPVAIALEPASRLNVSLPELVGTEAVAIVRVQNADGRPFRTIEWSGQTRDEWRVTGARLELSSLPPSVWTVTATTADGRSWQGQAATTAGGTVALVLE